MQIFSNKHLYGYYLNLPINLKMHALQPKHTKLKKEEVDKLLSSLNISLAQLPKIKTTDPGLPEGCEISDVIKIERDVDGKIMIYYRVVSV